MVVVPMPVAMTVIVAMPVGISRIGRLGAADDDGRGADKDRQQEEHKKAGHDAAVPRRRLADGQRLSAGVVAVMIAVLLIPVRLRGRDGDCAKR